MAEFTHSFVLFLDQDGDPMKFFMRSCSSKSHIADLIEHGGGMILSFPSEEAIRLVEPGSKVLNVKKKEQVVSVNYIHECVKKNVALDISPFIIEVDSLDISDISDSELCIAPTEKTDFGNKKNLTSKYHTDNAKAYNVGEKKTHKSTPKKTQHFDVLKKNNCKSGIAQLGDNKRTNCDSEGMQHINIKKVQDSYKKTQGNHEKLKNSDCDNYHHIPNKNIQYGENKKVQPSDDKRTECDNNIVIDHGNDKGTLHDSKKVSEDHDIIEFVIGNRKDFLLMSPPSFCEKIKDSNILTKRKEVIQKRLQEIKSNIDSYNLPPEKISTFKDLCERKRNSLTRIEELKILSYVIENKLYSNIQSNSLFQEMEVNKITSHSWRSMKNHFHNYIIKNLTKYNIPKMKLQCLLSQLAKNNVSNVDTLKTEVEVLSKSETNNANKFSKLKRKQHAVTEDLKKIKLSLSSPKFMVSSSLRSNTRKSQKPQFFSELVQEVIDIETHESLTSLKPQKFIELSAIVPVNGEHLTNIVPDSFVPKGINAQADFNKSDNSENFLPSSSQLSMVNTKKSARNRVRLKLYDAEHCSLFSNNTPINNEIIVEDSQKSAVSEIVASDVLPNHKPDHFSIQPFVNSLDDLEGTDVNVIDQGSPSLELIDNFDAELLNNLSCSSKTMVKDIMRESYLFEPVAENVAAQNSECEKMGTKHITVSHDELSLSSDDEAIEPPELEVPFNFEPVISQPVELAAINETELSDDESLLSQLKLNESRLSTQSACIPPTPTRVGCRKRISSSSCSSSASSEKAVAQFVLDIKGNRIDNKAAFLTEATAVVQMLESVTSDLKDPFVAGRGKLEKAIAKLKHKLYSMLLANQIEQIMQKMRLSAADQALMIKYIAHMNNAPAMSVLESLLTES